MPVSTRKPAVRAVRSESRTDLYLPAMWPFELQQFIQDWYRAWRNRNLYRRLLLLNDDQLAERDLLRIKLRDRANLPLRKIVAEQRRRRGAQVP